MVIVISILWGLVFFNWVRFRDYVYPALVQSLLWAVIVTLFTIKKHDFLPVSRTTWVILTLGPASFTMGAFIATYGHVPFRGRNYLRRLPKRLPSYLLVFCTLALLPYLAMKAYAFATQGPFQNGFANLRYAMTTGSGTTGGYGILAYLFPLAFFAAGIQMLRFAGSTSRNGRFITWLSIATAFVYGVLSSGRGILLTLLLIIFMIPIVLRTVRVIPAALLLATLSFLMFVTLGVLMWKGGNVKATFSENVSSMATTIEVYLLASIPAFDHLVRSGSPYYFGEYSFRTFFAVLRAIGVNVSVKPLVQDFVYVPMPTNIYTVYQPYFLDFGLPALPLAQFIFGFLHGFIYRKATIYRPHPFYVFLLSILMLPLVSQYGGDLYFSLLSMWIQYLTYSIAFTVVLSRQTGAI